ncbi:uncharacterized protein LOC132803786 [Ziziphus jujuba]|uniref:Uncharacterized protein LOC132803786 n=1 Tax=Ziziphus jujuba TaxID=326968 RepID=A0ABM4A991_ZIZJJ|nr:uncharacterized protein LOC132803786 [Ziziphus jujuba]
MYQFKFVEENITVHLFFKCTVARALWLASPWGIKWENVQLPSLEAYLDRIADPVGSLPISHNDGDSFVLYAVIILESIWKIRNKLVCEGKRSPLEDEVRVINRRFDEFWMSRTTPANQLAPTGNQATTWSPPPYGTIKINSDASIGKDFASLGIVVRNHVGQVLKVEVWKERIDVAEAAEAAAICKALSMAVNEGFQDVMCESDAQSIVQALNNTRSHSFHWSADVFIKEILQLCPVFNSVTFAWTPRNNNRMAHLAVRWGLLNSFCGQICPFLISREFVEVMLQEGGQQTSS